MKGGALKEDSFSGRLSLLPALPEFTVKIVELLSGRNVSHYEIIGAIEEQQGMDEGLRALTNQAMFGGDAQLTTLTDLIDLLGLPRLRSVVVAYSVNHLFGTLSSARGHTAGLPTRISWEHALGVAFIAADIGRRIKYVRLEEALLAGLIHDIGRLVLLNNFPGKYSEVLAECYQQTVNINEVERAYIGISHDQASAVLIRHWQLPDALLAVAQYHHSCEQTPEHQTLVHLVTLANQIATLHGNSVERGEPIDPETNVSIQFLKLSAADLDQFVDRFKSHFETFRAKFMR